MHIIVSNNQYLLTLCYTDSMGCKAKSMKNRKYTNEDRERVTYRYEHSS